MPWAAVDVMVRGQVQEVLRFGDPSIEMMVMLPWLGLVQVCMWFRVLWAGWNARPLLFVSVKLGSVP